MTPSGHSVCKGDSFWWLSGKLPVTLAQQFLQPNSFHSPPFIPGAPTSPRFSGSQGPRRSHQRPSHIFGGRCPAVPISQPLGGWLWPGPEHQPLLWRICSTRSWADLTGRPGSLLRATSSIAPSCFLSRSALASLLRCSQGWGVRDTRPAPHSPVLQWLEKHGPCSWPTWFRGRREGSGCITNLMGARRSADSCRPGDLAGAPARRAVLLKGSAGSGFWGGLGLRVPCNKPEGEAWSPSPCTWTRHWPQKPSESPGDWARERRAVTLLHTTAFTSCELFDYSPLTVQVWWCVCTHVWVCVCVCVRRCVCVHVSACCVKDSTTGSWLSQ